MDENIFCEDKFPSTRQVTDEKCEFTFVNDHFKNKLGEVIGNLSSKKNGQATYIAPLQPSTLATFRSWGISTGAGRIRLAQGCKDSKNIFHFQCPGRDN